MACPQKLVNLPCGSLGVGFLSQGNSCNTDTLQLIFENGQNGAPVYYKRVNGEFVM